MNIILLVAGALLAAVGLADIIARAVCRAQTPGEKGGVYRVVRLSGDAKKLEDRMRHELLLLQWNTPMAPEELVFVDGGLGGEERRLAEGLLRDFQGVPLCGAEELAALLLKG